MFAVLTGDIIDSKCNHESFLVGNGFIVPQVDFQVISARLYEGSIQYGDQLMSAVGDDASKDTGFGLILRQELSVQKRAGCNRRKEDPFCASYPYEQRLTPSKWSFWPMQGQPGCMHWTMDKQPTIQVLGKALHYAYYCR